MAKKRIDGGIGEIIFNNLEAINQDGFNMYKTTKEIIRYLDAMGMVIKSDAGLPECKNFGQWELEKCFDTIMGKTKGCCDFCKIGCAKVESLLDEATNASSGWVIS